MTLSLVEKSAQMDLPGMPGSQTGAIALSEKEIRALFDKAVLTPVAYTYLALRLDRESEENPGEPFKFNILDFCDRWSNVEGKTLKPTQAKKALATLQEKALIGVSYKELKLELFSYE